MPTVASLDDGLASMVIMRLGPIDGPPIAAAAADRLRARLPSLKGTPRLVALDRLADAAELGPDDALDEQAMIRKLEPVVKAYTDLIATPGFPTYAHADAVLLRAAHVEVETFDFERAVVLALRLLEHYPKSRWLADADVLLGDLEADRDPSTARRYFDDAIAIGRPALADYARFARLHVLELLDDFYTELDEAEQIARAGDGYREPATLHAVRAFARIGDPSDARARFSAMDPAHVPTLLRRLSDAYRGLGKYDDAAIVLGDILATSSDNLELCAVHERLFQLAGELDDSAAILNAARGLVAAVHRANDPRCSAIADERLRDTAFAWQSRLVEQEAARQADEMWGYALAVVTTPEGKAVELRDHAYLLWELAVRRHTATAWYTAATAFDAAFVATQDQTLSAGAELARSNARR